MSRTIRTPVRSSFSVTRNSPAAVTPPPIPLGPFSVRWMNSTENRSGVSVPRSVPRIVWPRRTGIRRSEAGAFTSTGSGATKGGVTCTWIRYVPGGRGPMANAPPSVGRAIWVTWGIVSTAWA